MQFDTDYVAVNRLASSSLVFASQLAYFVCDMITSTMTIVSVVYLFLIITLSRIQSLEGATPNLPKQNLSKECLDRMKIFDFDCPVYSEPNDSIFEQRYDDLNKTCCDIYDGLEFHCQMYYSQDGTQFSKFGCLETVAVPTNYGGHIENYDTGQPVFKIQKLNDNEFHEPRLSWQVSFNYAVKTKSKCDGLWVEILCENFEGGDRKCTCKLGFYSSDSACQHGFTDDEACSCEKMDCPKGLCPYRSFNPGNHSCREMDFSSVNFTCRPCVNSSEPETVSTVPHKNTTSVMFNKTLDTVSNCSKIGLSTESSDQGTNYLLIGLLLTAVLLFAICVFVFVVVWRKPRYLATAIASVCTWLRLLPNRSDPSYSPVQF